ncbi:hypothetical protein [Flavobacterium anhuiense]|uniref:hypothetical protein n=1 Tax=Flavobacterium anhuiense TaxID=459526 RepID=UPI003D969A0B
MIKFPEVPLGRGPVVMLNLVQFKDRSIYINEYLPAFNKVIAELGIEGVKVKFLGEVISSVIAEENEQWDEVLLVEYPSAEIFKSIAESEQYQLKANPLRIAGTAKLKLIMTRSIDY